MPKNQRKLALKNQRKQKKQECEYTIAFELPSKRFKARHDIAGPAASAESR